MADQSVRLGLRSSASPAVTEAPRSQAAKPPASREGRAEDRTDAPLPDGSGGAATGYHDRSIAASAPKPGTIAGRFGDFSWPSPTSPVVRVETKTHTTGTALEGEADVRAAIDILYRDHFYAYWSDRVGNYASLGKEHFAETIDQETRRVMENESPVFVKVAGGGHIAQYHEACFTRRDGMIALQVSDLTGRRLMNAPSESDRIAKELKKDPLTRGQEVIAHFGPANGSDRARIDLHAALDGTIIPKEAIDKLLAKLEAYPSNQYGLSIEPDAVVDYQGKKIAIQLRFGADFRAKDAGGARAFRIADKTIEAPSDATGADDAGPHLGIQLSIAQQVGASFWTTSAVSEGEKRTLIEIAGQLTDALRGPSPP